MGAISDRTRTRFGRRRPYLLAGSLLVVPAMAMLWLPTPPVSSQLGLMLWAMVSYVCYNSIQTMMAVPYASLSTELSTVPGERDKANVLRLLFSTVASPKEARCIKAPSGSWAIWVFPLPRPFQAIGDAAPVF